MDRQRFFLLFVFFLFTLLLLPNPAPAQISLAWDANPEPVSGYMIYYGVSPGSYPVQINAGQVTQYRFNGLTPGNTYYFVVTAYNNGGESSPSNEVSWTYAIADSRPLAVGLGVYREGQWFFDRNLDGAWNDLLRNPQIDQQFGRFGGYAQDIPLVGNWAGNGRRIGIYRDGNWFFDRNGNGVWDDCSLNICIRGFGGLPEDLPVVGDWTGNGITKIGIYRSGEWLLDQGNGRLENCNADLCLGPFGGGPEDIPVTGDWTGAGTTKIGIYRNGQWYLDRNGNGVWEGCQVDICGGIFGGAAGDIPVVGDWNGDGLEKIGIFRSGMWYLDFNGNGAWDGCGTDKCAGPIGGFPADLPIVR
jgi:hypothetical protein